MASTESCLDDSDPATDPATVLVTEREAPRSQEVDLTPQDLHPADWGKLVARHFLLLVMVSVAVVLVVIAAALVTGTSPSLAALRAYGLDASTQLKRQFADGRRSGCMARLSASVVNCTLAIQLYTDLNITGLQLFARKYQSSDLVRVMEERQQVVIHYGSQLADCCAGYDLLHPARTVKSVKLLQVDGNGDTWMTGTVASI